MPRLESGVIAFFDRESKIRDSAFQSDAALGYEQRMRQQAVLALLGPGPSDNVLDVGCGNGRDSLPILSSGARYVGMDLSKEMLLEAQQKASRAGREILGLVRCSGTNLPFCKSAFEKILCSEVIEHVPKWKPLIGELGRTVKVGGSIVISTPNRRSFYGLQRFLVEKLKRWRHPYDSWKTYAELRTALLEAGLTVDMVMGACYLPGQLSYILPARRIISPLLPLLERWEIRFLRSGRLTRRFGYMICVRGRAQVARTSVMSREY